MTPLCLYSHPLSTYARRVRIALLEKGIGAQVVEVDMAAGAHRREPYLSLNPYARVPTLVATGPENLVLYESTVILDYLEARYPEPALVPPTLDGRALVAMHMRLCDHQLGRPSTTVLFPKRFLPEAKWRRDEMAKASAEIARHLAIVERQLEGKTYLVGEAYSLADLCYVPFVHFLPLLEVAPPPNVKAWAERIGSRPSSVATAPDR